MNKSSLITIVSAAALSLAKNKLGSHSNQLSTIVDMTFKVRCYYGLSDEGDLADAEFYWGMFDEMFVPLINDNRYIIEIDDEYEEHPDNERFYNDYREQLDQVTEDDVEWLRKEAEQYSGFNDWTVWGELKTLEEVKSAIDENFLSLAPLMGQFWNDLSQIVTFKIKVKMPTYLETPEKEEFIEEIEEKVVEVCDRFRADGMWVEPLDTTVSPDLDTIKFGPLEQIRKNKGVQSEELRRR